VPSMPDFEFDVFLSHSAKDKAIVRAIVERLRADGLRVWFDEWVLKPGDSIPAKLEHGLEHSRVLVLCMSGNAFRSDWAQMEAGTFRFRDPLNKERRFIPLRLDDAPIKGALAQLLFIDWRAEDREQAYAMLLDACRPPAMQSSHIEVLAKREAVTPEKLKADESDESNVASIFVPIGYTDKFYIYSAYYLPLLFDKQYVFGPTKFGAQAVDVPAGDILTLALANDPAIVPVGFDRWIKGEEYRNAVLSPRIRETQGPDEARKVLYVPEFDGKLEAVYKDASFEWFSNRVSSAEEQQSFVEGLLTENFIKALATASQGISLPPELARLRPLDASVSNAELWHDFARHFLTMYVGDRGVAAKFGARVAQSVGEWAPLYRLVDKHLGDAEINLGAAYGKQTKQGRPNETERLGDFNPIDFLNDVIKLRRPGGAMEIMRIRERGHHRQFRNWVMRFFNQKYWSTAGVTAEEIVDEMKRELRINSIAVRQNLLKSLQLASVGSRPFSALASLVTISDDATSMELVRTLMLTSDLLAEAQLAKGKRELSFYSTEHEDFYYSYPIDLRT
jgi:hypothetical protein